MVVTPTAWYYRITLHQERELQAVIGDCRGLTYREAIEKVNQAKYDKDKARLTKYVTEAAERAGCLEKRPLVDDDLANHLRDQRRH